MKTKNYRDFKKEQQDKVDNFPIIFAYSNKQLDEGKLKLGIKDNKELVSIGAGGYLKKTDRKSFDELFNQLEVDKVNWFKNSDNLFNALVYELNNHEYCITGDATDTLESLGLDINNLTKEQDKILRLATRADNKKARF
jgi:hypothetical protein